MQIKTFGSLVKRTEFKEFLAKLTRHLHDRRLFIYLLLNFACYKNNELYLPKLDDITVLSLFCTVKCLY